MRPRRVLSLLAALAVAAAAVCVRAAQAQPSAAASASALPSAGDVLAKYRAALGGEEAIRRHTSRRMLGRFELPAQSIAGPFEMIAAAPDRMRLRIELGGLGVLLRGYDGKVAWAIDPAVGPRIIEGAELDEVRHSADFYYELHDPAEFASLTVVERAPFEGRDCYTVKAVRKSGFEVLEYYDAATGLMAGFRMTSSSPMGTVPNVVTVFGDYKNFGGLMIPAVARQRALGVESVLTVDKVEFDDVQADAFELPKEIAALSK